MARFVLVALCVTATFAATPLEFGMEMGNRAYKDVCWYEHLKVFPNTKSKTYGDCSGGADHIIKEVTEPDPTNKAYFDFYPEKRDTWFGERVPSVMGDLPSEYNNKCAKFLKDINAAPSANEGDALNDGGNDYPYKAFAYCLMQTLRAKYGDGAVESVKVERTLKKKHWMQALLDRENEFRARHGVEPLELATDLMEAAQGWADTNAKKCDMYHSKDDERKWNGESTGESLSAGFGDDKGDAAYQAADGWYEEIRDYPYPDGYKGTGNDPLFEKIGHFTQSVWKGSKYVGYGYAHNKDCANGKFNRYVAARYYPAGNMEGEYINNVNPPKD